MSKKITEIIYGEEFYGKLVEGEDIPGYGCHYDDGVCIGGNGGSSLESRRRRLHHEAVHTGKSRTCRREGAPGEKAGKRKPLSPVGNRGGIRLPGNGRLQPGDGRHL